MAYEVDFTNVSTIGLESSPVAVALAGLRANEARYFRTRYDHDFVVEPADEARKTVDWVHRILEEERDLVIQSRPSSRGPSSSRDRDRSSPAPSAARSS